MPARRNEPISISGDVAELRRQRSGIGAAVGGGASRLVWVPSDGIAPDIFSIAGSGDTTHTLTYLPYGIDGIYLNGVLMVEGDDYTLDYPTGTFTVSIDLAAGDTIEAHYVTTRELIAKRLHPEGLPVALDDALWTPNLSGGVTSTKLVAPTPGALLIACSVAWNAAGDVYGAPGVTASWGPSLTWDTAIGVTSGNRTFYSWQRRLEVNISTAVVPDGSSITPATYTFSGGTGGAGLVRLFECVGGDNTSVADGAGHRDGWVPGSPDNTPNASATLSGTPADGSLVFGLMGYIFQSATTTTESDPTGFDNLSDDRGPVFNPDSDDSNDVIGLRACYADAADLAGLTQQWDFTGGTCAGVLLKEIKL